MQCDATVRALESQGTEYTKLDITEHPEKLAEFRGLGHLTAPVVEVGDRIWSGFQPDQIKSLA